MRRASNYAPPAPFSARPDVLGPHGDVACWFTDPPGVILQFVRPTHSTLEHAKWLVTSGHRLLEERFPDSRSFITVLDLRLMTSRDIAGRSLVLKRSLARRNHFQQSFVLLPESSGPIYRTSVQAAVTLMRVMGFPVDVVGNLDDAIRAVGLRPAAAPRAPDRIVAAR